MPSDMFEVATLLGRHTFDWVGWSLGALIGIVASGIEPGRIRRLGLIDHAGRSDESAVAAVIAGLNRLDLAVPTAEEYVTPVQAASPIRPFTDFLASLLRLRIPAHRQGGLPRSTAVWSFLAMSPPTSLRRFRR